ncbi:esterase FE4-like [Glossina fuscipes]|uniref:Carboxylic ester hydrolase n=1 Tax=Glossina fuscipes TaxID=7396 RepID=A0A9C5Z7A1_9MUSC|nr:esterase FE4-like [Glossina fuscipes]
MILIYYGKFNWIILFLFLYIRTSVESSKRYYVDIHTNDFDGEIVGLEMRDWLNETFVGFLGIPYAKPPTNERRFRDPQNLDFFNGTIEAFYDGYECPSITTRNQSEDCLTLNVFTKDLKPKEPLPIVVAIHPGGLYLLSGASYFMSPQYLLNKKVVLVTFNYRLGSLGFLNLGTSAVPGNAGFKDQVFALRWIQKYIHYFGGNPKDVTLMGYSAGALSVSLHLVSPMSKGLFHKAIVMSGSLPPQVDLPIGNQQYLAIRQARVLNCTGIPEQWDESSLLQCFDQFKGSEIAKTLRKMFIFGKDNPVYLWLPIIEKDFGQEAFLIEDPYKTLKELPRLDIPVMIGYTNGEFCDSATNILHYPELIKTLQKDYETLFPITFMYENSTQLSQKTKSIIQHYLPEDLTLTANDYDNLCDLFSDSLLRYGAHHLADIVAAKGQVFFYEFAFIGKYFVKSDSFPDRKERAVHMDDMQYIFNRTPKSQLSEEDANMVDLFTGFLYDFIKNGKQTDALAKPYPHKYALIDEKITYTSGRNFPNYQLWKNLFKK